MNRIIKNKKLPGSGAMPRGQANGRTPCLYGKKPGVSLLLGLGIIFILVFFSMLVGNVVISSIRQTSNVSRSNEAYFAAEGALEQGLLENFEKDAGYTSGNEPVDYGNTNISANYQIQGTVPEELKYGQNSIFYNMYGVPTPGTGNAGQNCDPNNPVINQRFYYNYTTDAYTFYDSASGNEDPADHPCNWNKIKTGESVTIPLYYEDANGTHNLFGESSQEQLWVRLRTPCKPTTTQKIIEDYCIYTTNLFALTSRYALQDMESQFPKDDPILTWQIQGIDEATGKSVAMNPVIEYYTTGDIKYSLSFTSPPNIIPEKWINYLLIQSSSSINRYRVFTQNLIGTDLEGTKGCILQFFGSTQTMPSPCPPVNPWGGRKIIKPVLKLSVIGNLTNKPTITSYMTTSSPYLEYQILSSSNLTSPPVNTSQTITAEGVSGTFKQVLQVNQPQAGGLPDYVVQQ